MLMFDLAFLKRSDDERISLVNERIVEEVLLPLGQLDFGTGIVTKCDVIGLFAFRPKVKFDPPSPHDPFNWRPTNWHF